MSCRQYFVYIMTNRHHTVLYTGVTNNLVARAYTHKQHVCPGFTSKYNVTMLVYYEIFDDVTRAIEREKQIKAGSRKRKIELINGKNPEWRDLFQSLLEV